MVYRKPPTAGKRIPQGKDGLLDRCREHLQRASYPKSARDLVAIWYSDWRGRKPKPSNMARKNTGWHVDRVAAWLRFHEKAGRLYVVDTQGKRGAKRYLQVKGANWGRGKAATARPNSQRKPPRVDS